jgi:hypothetical protein
MMTLVVYPFVYLMVDDPGLDPVVIAAGSIVTGNGFTIALCARSSTSRDRLPAQAPATWEDLTAPRLRMTTNFSNFPSRRTHDL